MQKDYSGGIGGVAHVGVYFNHRAFVHVRAVVCFVVAAVIGVDAVCHIGADEEAGGETLLVKFLCGRGVFGDFVVAHVTVRGRGAVGGGGGEGRKAFDYAGQEVALGALRGGRADFFVVEAGHETDCAVAFVGFCR